MKGFVDMTLSLNLHMNMAFMSLCNSTTCEVIHVVDVNINNNKALANLCRGIGNGYVIGRFIRETGSFKDPADW